MNARCVVLIVFGFATVAPVAAQSSASYRLTEQTENAAGHPSQNTTLASAGFRVRLDALGGAAARVGLSGSSFRSDTGFVTAYPPPLEVGGLAIAADRRTWSWNPEKSIGSYSLYRDLLQALPGTFGTCLQAALATNTWVDVSTPPVGKGWFYLVTARNRLREEGTKGRGSNGVDRGNPAPCP